MKTAISTLFLFVSVSSFAGVANVENDMLLDIQELKQESVQKMQEDLDYLEENNVVLVRPHKQHSVVCSGNPEILSSAECFAVEESQQDSSDFIAVR